MPGGKNRSATDISIGGNAPPANPCKVRSTISTSTLGASGQRMPSSKKAPMAHRVNRRRENVAAHQGANAMALMDVALYTASNQVLSS